MFTTIALSVLLLIGLALLFLGLPMARNGDRSSDARDFGLATAAAGALALLAALVWGLIASITIVGANEVGVPVSFGRIGDDLQSGPHVTAPWTKVETLPTRPRTFEVVAKVRTNESGTVAVKLSGRWATDKANAEKLYQQVRTGDEEKIQAELIGPNLVSAAGAFYGGLTNFDSVTGEKWETNAAGVEAVARRYLTPYGVALDTVRVRQVDPDAGTERNIATYSAQQRATLIALEGQKTAAAEAKRQQIVADGQKAAARALDGLTATELQALCLQAGERVATANAAKGLATYALPCGGGAAVIAK